MQMVNGFPRRNRIDHYTPAEKAIHDAMHAAEHAGAHPLLTDALTLLKGAQDKVADFVELEPVVIPKAEQEETLEIGGTSYRLRGRVKKEGHCILLYGWLPNLNEVFQPDGMCVPNCLRTTIVTTGGEPNQAICYVADLEDFTVTEWEYEQPIVVLNTYIPGSAEHDHRWSEKWVKQLAEGLPDSDLARAINRV